MLGGVDPSRVAEPSKRALRMSVGGIERGGKHRKDKHSVYESTAEQPKRR